jgi:anaerobic selenocysteine-containing dehydrogenase
MTGRSRGIRDLAGPPCCSIHPDDAAGLGIVDRALVEIRTPHGAVVVQARISREAPPGHVLLPLGYDEVPVQTLFRWPATAIRAEIRALVATGAPR